ncbi:hypothetical protein [Flavobacterium restrictum]|uniref:Response regulatory domain-containing protein n=1 Tax=Flavobacterium restrictum TaxID=2594428 RepID=A0A553DY39_9FLAO|nr:hypothetical protein [Flavobacterium restrictum]TRX37602.1 hypothetical protein FNW21_12525 [Flavobacterium restrictum]
MNKRKGLVCDNQKYFSRFLNYEFKDDFSFDVYRDFEHLDHNDLNDYSVIIFVVYLEEELFDLMKVYKKEIPLIVCTFNKKILGQLQQVEDIFLVDSSKLRSQLITDMKYCFNSLIND